MKNEYRKYNRYINLKNDHKSRMHALVQKEVSLRIDRPLFHRCEKLMKIKKYNINKAMKRLQLYKARNIDIINYVDKSITKEYNMTCGVKDEV